MKAIILADEFGTRINEETCMLPKAMVEIGGFPILWHILKLYSAHGINDFIICCGHEGYVIKEYFANYFLHTSNVTCDISQNTMTVHNPVAEPWRVTLVDTGEATGTGGRLRKIAKFIEGGESFCMSYGDTLADIDITSSVSFHKAHGKSVTMTCIQPAVRLGALGLEDTKVYSLREMPSEDGGWINSGFFILKPDIFSDITDDSQMFEQEPVQALGGARAGSGFLPSRLLPDP